jgi:hypothetical protein
MENSMNLPIIVAAFRKFSQIKLADKGQSIFDPASNCKF